MGFFGGILDDATVQCTPCVPCWMMQRFVFPLNHLILRLQVTRSDRPVSSSVSGSQSAGENQGAEKGILRAKEGSCATSSIFGTLSLAVDTRRYT